MEEIDMALRKKRVRELSRARIGLRPGEQYTKAELAAIWKGTPVEVIARRKNVLRILRENRKVRKELRRNLAEGREKDANIGTTDPTVPNWQAKRSYSYYHHVFTPFLGRLSPEFEGHSLLEVIASIAPKKGPLRVFEDGAGTGTFLAVLTRKLAGEEIKTETETVVLKKHKKLRDREAKGRVGRAIETPAEFFIPDGKFHLIISGVGSINYTPYKLTKDHLLKYCQALEKGGIALINFVDTIDLERTFDTKLFKNVDELKKGAKKYLKKLGFKAEFFSDQDLHAIWPRDSPARRYTWSIVGGDFLIIRRER